MTKRISTIEANQDFAMLLRDVAAEGEVQIFDQGELVALLLSPGELATAAVERLNAQTVSRQRHVTPTDLALAAQRLRALSGFDDD
jgi:antitoxin (DNA-binding transcriptional repressor) of toxin-antitoxin stability system